MKYVTHVEGTVKGLVKTDLAERTVIVGPNWSHKSAIVNTVELALTGAASDVMGRAVVKDAAMLESLGNEIGVTGTVTLSDGAVVEWRKEVGKKATGPAALKGTLPRVVFPLRDVREALAGNANTVRQFFLRLAAGAVTWDEVLARVPTPLHPRLDALVLRGATVSAVDRLLGALEVAGERLREARGAAKAQNTVADRAGSGLGPPPSEGELGAARAALDAKRAEIERLERAHEVALLVRKGQALRQELNGLSGPTPADEVRPAQVKLVKFAADHDLRDCPVCGKSVALAGTAPDWTARLAKVEEKLIARERVLQGHREVQVKLGAVKAELARRNYDAQSPLDHPDGGLIESMIVAEEDYGHDLEEARGDLAAAQQIYDEMQRTAGAWEQIRRARDMAAEAEEDLRQWESLISALQRAVRELLDRSVESFRASVQAHLPASWRFQLQLRDGEKEVCRYGLEEAGRLRTALSGGQWATVTTAIACVVLERSSIGEDGLAIIVPEDRAWDAGALSEVLSALAKAPGQVIVATTTMPDPQPPGWLILQTAQDGTIVSRVETVELKRGRARADVQEPPAPAAPPAPPKRRGRPPKATAAEAPPAPEPAPAAALAPSPAQGQIPIELE